MGSRMDQGYEGWLRYSPLESIKREQYAQWCGRLICRANSGTAETALHELRLGIASLLELEPQNAVRSEGEPFLLLGLLEAPEITVLVEPTGVLLAEGYRIQTVIQEGVRCIVLAGKTDKGLLYAVFHFLRLLQTGQDIRQLSIVENPRNQLRMLNHWDNLDGSIERGYAGKSIFYWDDQVLAQSPRVRDYARLLASIGVNGIVINNVNVHRQETLLMTEKHLPEVARVAAVFRDYGITVYLSINYAAPIELGDLDTADPLDSRVADWWKRRANEIYKHIPDFGGFLVKADSEFRPGPFTYGRNHADGANMLAEALEPYGGLVIWRCFVYNCQQDWRDRTTDRARAAYDHFVPLDGSFRDNVILQIKNGPMDFQVREPVSPLFGGMKCTNQMLELQITQEYTGQQKHLCFLVPQWKQVVDFDTYAQGEGTTVADIASGSAFARPLGGFAAVSNVGDDINWTGHTLAQSNWYGFGRLAWNPALSAEEIAREWTVMTFGADLKVADTICGMLLGSWAIYENYTSPLGVGWMVNPGHHYGPNVDGYEYSRWGTYHFADCRGIGVDRTMQTGTGYTGQYHAPQAALYESLDTCPDELLLFFHHVPYTHQLRSGKSVIQHIYDSHFDGAQQAAELVDLWTSLEGKVDEARYSSILERLREQAAHAEEWRDTINTYFYRKSGIPDERNRKIYT
jgi:alpha-glucuronidase